MTSPETEHQHTTPEQRVPAQKIANVETTRIAAEQTAAEQAAVEFAIHGDPTIAGSSTEEVRPRTQVKWARVTELAPLAGGAILARGAQLNTQLRDAVLDGVRTGRDRMRVALAHRQARLDPTTDEHKRPERATAREGVSR